MKRVRKFCLPAFVLVVLFATWHICSKYLTLELDISQAFDTTVPPPPGNSEGLSVKFGGPGGSIILGMSMPRYLTNSSGKVIGVEQNELASESLALTPKKLEEIQSSLNSLDPEKWEILTKLPAPIFRFNLYLLSYKKSVLSDKKFTYFHIIGASGKTNNLAPGQSSELGKGLQIGEISQSLASTKIDIIYTIPGSYTSHFDANGRFISQATGEIIIKPTWFAICSVAVGVWIVLLALLKLIKETLLLPKELDHLISSHNKS